MATASVSNEEKIVLITRLNDTLGRLIFFFLYAIQIRAELKQSRWRGNMVETRN